MDKHGFVPASRTLEPLPYSLRQQIAQTFNQVVKTEELVLLFQVGGNPQPCALPQIVETPSQMPSNDEDVNVNTTTHPIPCTILDCSGLRISQNSSPEENAFMISSLLILSKHLQQVENVKVVIAYGNGGSTEESFGVNWRSSFLSCPAVHIFELLTSEYKSSSFGLVAQASQLNHCLPVPDNPQRGNQVEALSSLELELEQLQLNFFNELFHTDNVLVLETWNGKVPELIARLPFFLKLSSFCQDKILPSHEITGKLAWKLAQRAGDVQKFDTISTQLESHIKDLHEKLLRPVLDRIIHTWADEKENLENLEQELGLRLVPLEQIDGNLPQNKNYLAKRLKVMTAQKLLNRVMISPYDYHSLNELASTMDFILGDIPDKLRRNYDLLQLLQEMSSKILPVQSTIVETDLKEGNDRYSYYQNFIYNQCQSEDAKDLEIRILQKKLNPSRNQSLGNCTAEKKPEVDNPKKVDQDKVRIQKIVTQIQTEMTTFISCITASLQGTLTLEDITYDTITVKLKTVSDLFQALQNRQQNAWKSCSENVSLVYEMNHVSELLLSRTAYSSVFVMKVMELQDDLEALFASMAKPSVGTFMRKLAAKTPFAKNWVSAQARKSHILKESLSPLLVLMEQLSHWKSCLEVVTFLKDYSITYDYHRKPEVAALKYAQVEGDAALVSFLEAVVPISQRDQVPLDVFKVHAWPELKSLATKIINYSGERAIQVQRRNSAVQLVVTGNYLKFSDFWDTYEFQMEGLEELRILAREVLFIDRDLYDEKRRELEVTLISPVVEVIGVQRITLIGRDAENSSSFIDAMAFSSRSRGRHGSPGNCGGNGGNLVVICDSIVNEHNLQVNCRGGNGGKGRDGEDGPTGKNGIDATPTNFKFLNLDGREFGEFKGWPGYPGGDGGDGGKGGLPGYGGNVTICPLAGEHYKVAVSTTSGHKGEDGKGGVGGRGGKQGNGLRRTKKWLWSVEEEVIYCPTRAQNGNSGRPGVISKGLSLPNPKKSPKSVANAISDFRDLAEKDSFKSLAAKELLTKIDHNVTLLLHSTTQSLLTDLLKLAGNSKRSDPISYRISQHEHFQNRLAKYSQAKGQVDLETGHVLKLLSAFSQSQVMLLKEHNCKNSCQVVNVEAYFDLVNENIQKLEASQVNFARNQALQKYQQRLLQKSEDVQKFMSGTVTPAISEAQKEIQAKMESFWKELAAYKEKAESDLMMRQLEYANYKAKRDNLSTMQTVLSTLNSACQVVLFIGQCSTPLLSVVGVTEIVTLGLMQVTDRYMPEAPSQPNLQLPGSLNLPRDEVEEMRKTAEQMSEQWELVSSFLRAHVPVNRMISPFVIKWRKNIDRLQAALQSDFGDVLEARTESEHCRAATIEGLLQCKATESLAPDTVSDLDKLLIRLDMYNCSLTTLKDGGTNKDLIVPITDDLTRVADQQLQNLVHRQKGVYEVLIPLVQNVTENLKSLAEESPISNTAAGRRVTKWNVHGMLQELKMKMTEFVKDFNCEAGLIRSLESFGEAISLLQDLQGMMEEYQESLYFSELLHELTAQQLDIAQGISDPALKTMIAKLDYLLKANVFLLEYNQALNVFKQWVFPFANKYSELIRPMTLPDTEIILRDDRSVTSYEAETKELCKEYAERLRQFREIIKNYKAKVVDFDSAVFTGKCQSSSKNNPPFFVWNGDEWYQKIRHLLEGEEVEFWADVRKAVTLDKGRRAAIKFTEIEVLFQHENGFGSEEQKKLNEILKEQYSIRMVHGGTSYYRVFSECFVMHGSKEVFSYSLDKSARNMTQEKIAKSGDFLLSPYTTWSFKLENRKTEGDNSVLEEFKERISLELGGTAWFVDEVVAKEQGLHETYLRNLGNHYEMCSENWPV